MRVLRWADSDTMVRRGMRSWGPFDGVIATMMRKEPLQTLAARLWRNEARMSVFAPAFDVCETKDAYLFKGDLPGFHEKDLEISLSGHELFVTGRRDPDEIDKADTYHFAERAHGAFSRSFILPEQINHEQIHAELREGVLTITVPKSSEARKISVRAGERREAKA